MIPQRIIEKAIAGGWHKAQALTLEAVTEQGAYFNDGLYHFLHAEIALDPDFWMALGKEGGWNNIPLWHEPTGSYIHKTTQYTTDWQFAAHRLYDLILRKASQDEINSFWASL